MGEGTRFGGESEGVYGCLFLEFKKVTGGVLGGIGRDELTNHLGVMLSASRIAVKRLYWIGSIRNTYV